jgi:nucleotide-binding universal stress UspA family protein
VSVWDWSVAALGWTSVDELDLTEPTRAAVEEAVAKAVADTAGADGVRVRTHVTRGYAPQVLIECAAGADLLVVGSRGHGALAEVLLGSVSLHCATHAPCPVLIVRGSALDDPVRGGRAGRRD